MELVKEQAAIEDLEEFMEGLEIEDCKINVDEVNEGNFTITSKDQANFFLKKIKEVRYQKEEIEEAAKSEIEKTKSRIDTWKDKQLNSLSSSEQYFLNLLEVFANKEMDETNKKSVKLPEGIMHYKKQTPKYEYDDKVLKEFLQNRKLTDYIRIKEEPDKVLLKKKGTVKNNRMYIGNAEIQGISITDRDPIFEVK